MRVLQDLILRNEMVTLDDTHFIACTFIDCILQYSGGDVIFDRTEMRSCQHVFYGRARQTLHYLQNVGLMEQPARSWGEFPELMH